MEVRWDQTNLDRFVISLKDVPTKLGPKLAPAVKKLMQDGKNAQQKDLYGSSDNGFRAISYNVRYTEPEWNGTFLQSRLGIDKKAAGNLGNIAIFGTYKGGGTHMHPTFHLRNALPAATRYIAKAATEALRQ
nr:MAG TPA_asm: hypothetical protein [Caudoviricetes sp.]